MTQVTSVTSSKSESSSPHVVSHAADRNHTAGVFRHFTMGFEPSQSSSSFAALDTVKYLKATHLISSFYVKICFMRCESCKVMKFSPLTLTGLHTAGSPLCSMMDWLCSCSCRVTRFRWLDQGHSDEMLLVNVPSQSPFPCLLFSAVAARYHWGRKDL